jgi:hypothetical protein
MRVAVAAVAVCLLGACASRPLELPEGAPDLAVLDLSVADLSVADLSTADLSTADLSVADLRAADMSAPDLAAARDLAMCRAPGQLLSWWRADGDASDALGLSPGIVHAPVGFDPGVEQQAFRFSSNSTGFVEVPITPSLQLAGSFTVAAWLRLDALPTRFGPLLSRWRDAGIDDRGYSLCAVRDGNIRFDVSSDGRFGTPGGNDITAGTRQASADNALVVSNRALTLGQWHHVAGVFDATSGLLRVYVDGVADGDVTAPFHVLFEPGEPLLIGAGDVDFGRRFLDGALDDVRIYARALSDAEILELVQLRGNACL